MSMTKETTEFKEAFGVVNEANKGFRKAMTKDLQDIQDGKYAPDPPIKGTIPDEIDAIIAYFEDDENVKIDPPKGRYGVGIDMPDMEHYVADKLAARAYIINKFGELLTRLIPQMKKQRRR